MTQRKREIELREVDVIWPFLKLFDRIKHREREFYSRVIIEKESMKPGTLFLSNFLSFLSLFHPTMSLLSKLFPPRVSLPLIILAKSKPKIFNLFSVCVLWKKRSNMYSYCFR